MPIYEYACAACGHTFEEWQKMSDPPVRTCPKCKKKKVEKLISHTAFQLKGGGWYADLYSSSKGKGGDGDGKSSSSSESSGGDSKAKDSGGSDSGAAGSKKEVKGGPKDAKKKDTAKKSESRAA